MTEPVTYHPHHDGIATIVMDDGKANLMTGEMIAGLSEAFRRAAREGAVVVLTGRAPFFSAGYDRDLFAGPGDHVVATVKAGGELVHQILSHPLPTVAACTGHAIAQGAFVLLACDVRIGSQDPRAGRIGLNEVVIGLTIPHYGIEIARDRLTGAWFDHAAVTGALYDHPAARDAGFLHHLAPTDDVADAAHRHAAHLRGLVMSAHTGTKHRVRVPVIDAARNGIDREFEAATT